MKYMFVVLFLVHGLIHLMGFAKAFQWAPVDALTGPLSKPMGLAWLVASLLITVSAVLWLADRSDWWMIGAMGVLLSQVLIALYWKDARYGTIINLVFLIALLQGAAVWQWNREGAILRTHFQQTEPTAPLPKINATDIQTLPLPVQNWLLRSGVMNVSPLRSVYFRQKGELRLSPDGAWLPVNAEQYVRVTNPGFLWSAFVKMRWGIYVVGRDQYDRGKGYMLMKAQSAIVVANASGETINQGALLRYLAEICWFPTAALEPYIHWDAVDNLSAKATMTWGEVSASGIFRFTPSGDIESFEALRYYHRKDGDTLEKWFVKNLPDSYQSIAGLRIPTQSEVTWKLAEGDFNWFRLEIYDVHYQH